MAKVLQYTVVEENPGFFKAKVQYKGFFGTYWKAIGYHGDDRPEEYGSTEFSVAAAERHIQAHKERQITPWVPKTVYREIS